MSPSNQTAQEMAPECLSVLKKGYLGIPLNQGGNNIDAELLAKARAHSSYGAILASLRHLGPISLKNCDVVIECASAKDEDQVTAMELEMLLKNSNNNINIAKRVDIVGSKQSTMQKINQLKDGDATPKNPRITTSESVGVPGALLNNCDVFISIGNEPHAMPAEILLSKLGKCKLLLLGCGNGVTPLQMGINRDGMILRPSEQEYCEEFCIENESGNGSINSLNGGITFYDLSKSRKRGCMLVLPSFISGCGDEIVKCLNDANLPAIAMQSEMKLKGLLRGSAKWGDREGCRRDQEIRDQILRLEGKVLMSQNGSSITGEDLNCLMMINGMKPISGQSLSPMSMSPQSQQQQGGLDLMALKPGNFMNMRSIASQSTMGMSDSNASLVSQAMIR